MKEKICQVFSENPKNINNEMNYKKMIVELVEKNENEKMLKFIYDLIISFQKKWGI